MKFYRILPIILFIIFVSNACVNENDDPPGCLTPESPAINIQRTEFTEGQDIVLDGIAPASADGGAFEWQGPNNYYVSGQQLVIKNAKQVNEGEYRLYYLNKGRCRSKPASVFVTVYAYNEDCGLQKNTIREGGADYKVENTAGSVAGEHYFIAGGSSTIHVKAVFASKNKPVASTKYTIARNSGGQLAPNEVDIFINLNGQEYHALPDDFKTVTVFYKDNKMHMAFCTFKFGASSGKQLFFSGNLVEL